MKLKETSGPAMSTRTARCATQGFARRQPRKSNFPDVLWQRIVSRDLDLWAYHKGVVLDFSRPGKPTDNSYIESFNGKLRTR